MSDWLNHMLKQIALRMKSKTGFGPALVVCFVIAALSLVIALAFLCVALFAWLASRLDPVAAGLISAGAFLLIAIVAAVAGLIARMHAMEHAKRELAVRSQASFLDPKFLSIGVQLGQAIGWRRIAMLGALGFFAAGLGREWTESRKPRDGGGESH